MERVSVIGVCHASVRSIPPFPRIERSLVLSEGPRSGPLLFLVSQNRSVALLSAGLPLDLRNECLFMNGLLLV